MCSGGRWVRVSNCMYGTYFVDDKPKTYKFRLTIWDYEDKARVAYDIVYVDIQGGMEVSLLMIPPSHSTQ